MQIAAGEILRRLLTAYRRPWCCSSRSNRPSRQADCPGFSPARRASFARETRVACGALASLALRLNALIVSANAGLKAPKYRGRSPRRWRCSRCRAVQASCTDFPRALVPRPGIQNRFGNFKSRRAPTKFFPVSPRPRPRRAPRRERHASLLWWGAPKPIVCLAADEHRSVGRLRLAQRLRDSLRIVPVDMPCVPAGGPETRDLIGRNRRDSQHRRW